MKITFAICLLILSCAPRTIAHMAIPIEKTCPLCDTGFTTFMDISGTSYAMRLDLKPIGFIAAPWSLAVCPECRFVLYDDDISQEELSECRAIVASPAYIRQKDRASYFLLGLLYEGLKRDHLETAHIFLKASCVKRQLDFYVTTINFRILFL